MLQVSAVEENTFSLLSRLMQEPLLDGSRLVGGTSLALQLGHRKSTDLDFFSFEAPDIESIVSLFSEKYGYTAQFINAKSTIGYIEGIKIDVIYHPFQWLEDAYVEDGIRLAGLADIAAMKMHAIANSGQRPKDFVDIAYLSRRFSYNRIRELALKKYPMYDPIMFDKAIIYFGDIIPDAIDNIKMIGADMNWEKIESRIIKMTNQPDSVFRTAPLP